MKNTTINYIKILFEMHFEEICESKQKYKQDYIERLIEAYKEFISIYGDSIDGMALEHYKDRLGVEDE